MGKLLRRVSAFLHRRRIRRELEEEMAAHRERMPAERQRYFGSTLRLQEEIGDQWGWTWLDRFRQDLLYGMRSLRRSPGFTLTAVAVLALGIGVNLAEIHLFHAVLHRLQVRGVDSLYRFARVTRERRPETLSLPAIEFYRRHNTVLAAVIAETDVIGVHHAEDAADVRCVAVSGNLFGELGITPLYGRLLNEQDDEPGAPPVAVVGYDYWQNRFGSDPGVVLRDIRLNGKPVRVVGVAPAQFVGLTRKGTQIWLAESQYGYITGDSRLPVDFGAQTTFLVGRLKPGLPPARAEAQFRSLTTELRKQQPDAVEPDEWLKVIPVDDVLNKAPAVVLLFGTFVLLVLLVLLSACANLGNMLLARGFARQREIEIRLSLGAGRWRLVRQLMTENCLLAGIASVAALLVGRLAALLTLRIIGAPKDLRIVTDWRIVLACVTLGVISVLAFGLAPALQMAKGGPAATRARRVLITVQVAVSCVLLILSSFFTRAIERSFRADVTFDYLGMLVVDPLLYMHHYTIPQSRQAALEIAARLREVPGIDGASVVTVPPLRRSRIEYSNGQQLYLNEVDSSYFPMMRLPLVQGRLFGPAEEDAMVVSVSAAQKLWPNESPLGKTRIVGQRLRTVAGVVRDSGANLITYPNSVEVYLPVSDRYAIYVTILAHAIGNPAKISVAARSAATLPGVVPEVFTVESLIEDRWETMRKMAAVVVSLGAIASLLALLGMFGLLAFTVAQRTREIGVRMALGARAADILGCVLGQYALPLGMGAGLGVVIAAAAARIVGNILYGFLPFDALSFGAGLLLFAAVALAASVSPARRALQIAPAAALRYE
jgi:predicted permease